MRGEFNVHTVDKYLSPIRYQIINLVEPDSTVVEFGCGNGDLLLKLSEKIQFGIGFDKSERMISYASKLSERRNIKNLEFRIKDVIKEPFFDSTKDYSITSLLFHILTWNDVDLQQKVRQYF